MKHAWLFTLINLFFYSEVFKWTLGKVHEIFLILHLITCNQQKNLKHTPYREMLPCLILAKKAC